MFDMNSLELIQENDKDAEAKTRFVLHTVGYVQNAQTLDLKYIYPSAT